MFAYFIITLHIVGISKDYFGISWYDLQLMYVKAAFIRNKACSGD